MKIFLMVLLAIVMLAVIIVMLAGAIGIVDANRSGQASNRLMRLRVVLQAVAIGLVVLLMMTGR